MGPTMVMPATMEREHGAPRDVYAHLLRDTRGLLREQSAARDAWFAALPQDHKEETLFELEMLLKALACFGNLRNLAGPPRRTPAVAHDFRPELAAVALGLDRSVTLARQLLGERDRAYTFSRYLESLLPEDTDRSRLLQDQMHQDTPTEALFVLRHTFSGYLEIGDGLLRLGRIPHRLFFSLLGSVTREVGRNAYFNPLVPLEFRQEFDRIRNATVLLALDEVHSEAAHRVVALTFLTLMRALQYLNLVDGYASRPDSVPLCYLMLAVFRSDLRALTRFLGRRCAGVMADGLEHELLGARAVDLKQHEAELRRLAAGLVSLRGTLEMLANSLRVEVRRAFERDVPALDDHGQEVDRGAQIVIAVASLRTSMLHAIHTLCAELRPGQPLPDISEDLASQRAVSERLRRDVWTFAQILRAFVAKARATSDLPDHWDNYASFQFVREFLGHFRAIGYKLVRMADYARLDPFIQALETLRDVDLLDPKRLEGAIGECAAFHEFLSELFANISQRNELVGVPFDKHDAAESLKMYLDGA